LTDVTCVHETATRKLIPLSRFPM